MNDDHIYTRLLYSPTYGVKICLFDKNGLELYDRYTWYVVYSHNLFYLERYAGTGRNDKKNIRFHREFMGLESGDERVVDHWNGNSLDNQFSNLKIKTNQQNIINRTRLNKNNTSGFRGVSWNKMTKKWHAYIMIDRKRETIGYYTEKIDADANFRKRAKELFGEYYNSN